MAVNWNSNLQNARNQVQSQTATNNPVVTPMQPNYSQQAQAQTFAQPQQQQQQLFSGQPQQQQQRQQQYDPYYLQQMYNLKQMAEGTDIRETQRPGVHQNANQIRSTLGVASDWERSTSANDFYNQYLANNPVTVDNPHLQPYFERLKNAVQVARSTNDSKARDAAYRESRAVRAELASLGVNTDNMDGWAVGSDYSTVLNAYNQMYKTPEEEAQEVHQKETNLIDDISSKYGFDYSRDYAASQAEAIAQAQRDAVAQGRKSVDNNVMGAAEGLDRNYFLQAMNQAQMQTDSGLNAGIAADQNLRMAMSRQAEMGDIYRDANLRNFELDNTEGRIEQERLAYEDQLYNERLQQGFDNVQSERGYNLQEGQLTGRYTPEGVDQQAAFDLVEQLIGFKTLSDSGELRTPYDYALNHARANEVRSQLAAMGVDMSMLDRGASVDDIRANMGNLFNTAQMRDSALDRGQQQDQFDRGMDWDREQFDRGMDWDREQFEQRLKQDTEQFKKQLELSYDQLDQDQKQFLATMEWDEKRWNNLSADQKEGYKLAREQLAEQKRQHGSEQAWRKHTFNNMSAAEKANLNTNIDQFGDTMAWRLYEFDATMEMEKAYNSSSSSGGGGTAETSFSGGGGNFSDYTMTSPYGMRTHPITGEYKLHAGNDYSMKANTPVKANVSGKVVRVSTMGNKGWGKYLGVQDSNGYVHIYAHLNSQNVREGQSVKAGQVIARSGNTGASTGPHLHYEVRKGSMGGKTVNPNQFL